MSLCGLKIVSDCLSQCLHSDAKVQWPIVILQKITGHRAHSRCVPLMSQSTFCMLACAYSCCSNIIQSKSISFK